MRSIINIAIVLTCMSLITGCGTTGATQISPDTYIISKSSKAGKLTSIENLKAAAIREANSFAEKKGKVAIPISYARRRTGVGLFTVDIEFRVVDKDDPEALRTSPPRVSI